MKVLIADDDPVARRILQHHLESWGHSVVTAKDGAAAWEILQAPEAPRIALLDWMMPGRTGPEICKAIRQRTSTAYAYLVLITSREEKVDLIRGLDSGADDYLTKPVDSDELEVRLRVGLRVLDLEDRLVKSQEVLQFAATHDDLTRLNNRAAIDEMLRRELARSKRDDSSLSVLLLDIDHFKTVNDTYGHAVGDEVIRGIADRFSNVVRAYDSVGRYGGEEFLAILPGCDVAGVTDQAHRLLDVIRSRGFETSAGKLKITASVGAACNKDIPHATPLTLLRVADTRLYQAKYDGRNRAIVSGASANHLEAEILEMPIGASSKIAPQMVEPVSLGPPGFSPRR